MFINVSCQKLQNRLRRSLQILKKPNYSPSLVLIYTFTKKQLNKIPSSTLSGQPELTFETFAYAMNRKTYFFSQNVSNLIKFTFKCLN